MKLLLHGHPMAIVTLAIYLVNLVAGALHHHHHETENRLPNVFVTSIEGPSVIPESDDQDDGEDDDDDDDCLLCNVLHLAQTPATIGHFELGTALVHQAASAAPIIRPHPVAPATHSRAPPRS